MNFDSGADYLTAKSLCLLIQGMHRRRVLTEDNQENEGVLGPESGASAPGIQREALLPLFPSVRFAAVARFSAYRQDAKRPPATNRTDLPRTGEHKSPHERYFKIPRLHHSERQKRVIKL
jgi:hypothetical protein